MKSLVFEPLIPIALWTSLALAAIALLAWYARDCARRLGARATTAIVALMAMGVALPLGILFNPIWREHVPPPAGKPLVTVLLDATTSMATRDAGDGKSRFEQARDIAGVLAT